MRIISPKNQRLKKWSQLKSRKGRDKYGCFLVEGIREIERALAAGMLPRAWLISEKWDRKDLVLANAQVYELSSTAMRKVSYRENPPPIIGIFERPTRRIDDLPATANRVLVAVGIKKPGNLGALLRSADASGTDAVLVVGKSIDLENPHVIRTSTGTVFSQRIALLNHESAREWLRKQGLRIVASAPSGNIPYWEADLASATALVVGSEDDGLPKMWLTEADEIIYIPMYGVADSLNVSAAASILLFEALKQNYKNFYL